ncbi:MAG: gamma-glutamyltransferase [Pyrinomonadaceae bacterium]|nr:gamma-glutamyltransferase [Pyrinomonadaceae bacterium]
MLNTVVKTKFKPMKVGAVATAFPSATESAVEILRQGGNAFDAAMAAAWSLSVCEPSGSGLGGQTTALIHFANGENLVVDGNSYAPARVSLQTVSKTSQKIGFRACVIPSTPKVLGFIQENWGKFSLAQVMNPAIRLAEEGYQITRLQHRQMEWTHGFLSTSASISKLFLNNGLTPKVGEVFKQKELAQTLRILAKNGTEDFYQGEIAEKIDRDMRRNGGLLCRKDLRNFALSPVTEPLSVNYKNYRIVSAPMFSGGGLQLLLSLKLLEKLNDRKNLTLVKWYRNLADSIYLALRERHNLSFSNETKSLAEMILSETYTESMLENGIGKSEFDRWLSQELSEVEVGETDGETTHLCVADAEGNIVSLTQSIQSLFGAKVANEELGFIYNNYLMTCPRYEHPNQLGSNCSPCSNVAPTIIFNPNNFPVLTLGAAGSRRITSSILQTISSVIDWKLPLDEALNTPRIHALLNRKVWLEQPIFSEELRKLLKKKFRRIIVKSKKHYKMAAVQALQFDEKKNCSGAADPRREGNWVVI